MLVHRAREGAGDGASAAEPDARDGEGSVHLSVPEMDCASCAETVGGALHALEGVTEVDTRPATGTVAVAFDESRTDGTRIRQAIESVGYEVVEEPDAGSSAVDRRAVWTSGRARWTAVGAVLFGAGILAQFGLPAGPVIVGLGVSEVLFLGAVATAGREILRGGYHSARARSLDIDFLMTVAILGALGASVVAGGAHLYAEAATLAVLFSVAELLERHAMERARTSLRELMELSPDEATVRRDGGEVRVPVEEVAVGERVVVRPGERIPVDGVVREGATAVDESPVTGESVPVDKSPGEEVYAGTVNQSGYLEVAATTPAGEDTLSRVVQLVEAAQSDRTEREQFVDRFAGYYTPVMVAIATLVAVGPPLLLGAAWVPWFVNGITMLVLACPCALVISTPVTVVSGITSAANHGVLVKGGSHLEAMGGVDAVAMDKTGTLTTGELAVTDVVPIGDRTRADVLACASGLERRSDHPIARSIVDYATDGGRAHRNVAEFESLPGQGVRADLDGRTHYAGAPALFEDMGYDLDHLHVVGPEGPVPGDLRDLCERQGCLNLAEDTIPRLRAEGKTVVIVGTDEEIEGLLALADEVRPEAHWTVERLRERGLDVVMLTGDNERTARAVAETVGVGEVRAGLDPEEKVAAVEALEAAYPEGVAMVGDGINDAPALASATVGIAMGAAGTDTAIETADVALMGDDLAKLPYLVDVSDRSTGVIRQNIWASLGAKALLALGVPLGYVSLAVAVLVGDAGMTVGVTGNAMRLARVVPERFTGSE